MLSSGLERVLVWLARHQVQRPWWVVAVTALTLVPAALAASRLTLETSFAELLPDTKPSVVEMRRTQKRLSGTSTLTVVAEGNSTSALKKFVDALSPRIRELGPSLVAHVDDGNRVARAFFEKHQHLYAPLADLEELHDEIIERYDWEVTRQAGLDLGLGEAPPPLDADAIEARFRQKFEEATDTGPGLDGYYIGENGRLAAILVRTPFMTGDQRAFELQRKIEQLVGEIDPKRFDPSIQVAFTGNLITSAEQQRAVSEDLAHVGVWGVGLILAVVFLFFLRLRTLFAMALTIGVGCTWAFGLARLTVGHLNSATGFLVSIIAGNGINFGIIFMARYIEGRRDEHLDVAEALATAHRGTYGATLAAAGASMIAYGSLAVTDFRGFKHFGIIGGAGMILCWVATYLLLPTILAIVELHRPLIGADGFRQRWRGGYGKPFAWVAHRFPRAVGLVGVGAGVVSVGLAVRYFSHDPMEYDLTKVRNEELEATSAGQLARRVDAIVGRFGQDARAIVADRVDQVEPLVRELRRRRDAAPKGEKPFDRVVTVNSFLPKHQTEKIELLEEIDDRLERARRHGFLSERECEKLERYIPDELEPVTVRDLPEEITRPFEERDGTLGTIVYIVPTEGESLDDAHYLRRWADSFREVRLPDGEVIRGSGDAVIFSDMLIAVGEDAPKAITLSLLGTLLVILFAFRGRRAAFVTLLTLLLGLLWLVAFLALDDIKLNFLNFVALPISIGVGADYALNVMKRREKEPDESLHRVFTETGGAVVLCSLTTTLGYLALLLSINRAVQSFGLAAAAGEITTLLSAMLVLPAFLIWRAQSRKRRYSPRQ